MCAFPQYARALKSNPQSHKYAMKKVGERLLSPRVIASIKYASGYERTLEHLKVWKLVLPEAVKETEVSLPQSGEPQLGTQ